MFVGDLRGWVSFACGVNERWAPVRTVEPCLLPGSPVLGAQSLRGLGWASRGSVCFAPWLPPSRTPLPSGVCVCYLTNVLPQTQRQTGPCVGAVAVSVCESEEGHRSEAGRGRRPRGRSGWGCAAAADKDRGGPSLLLTPPGVLHAVLDGVAVSARRCGNEQVTLSTFKCSRFFAQFSGSTPTLACYVRYLVAKSLLFLGHLSRFSSFDVPRLVTAVALGELPRSPSPLSFLSLCFHGKLLHYTRFLRNFHCVGVCTNTDSKSEHTRRLSDTGVGGGSPPQQLIWASL